MAFVFIEPDCHVYRIIRFAAHYRIGFFIKAFELLATNKVYNDGSGNLDIRKAMEYFQSLYAGRDTHGKAGHAHLPQSASR